MSRYVVIVDDEPETNDILADLLRARGFEPIQLYLGAKTVETVEKYQPEIVLLDLMLPDLDGFKICEQLKLNRETNLIPVLMVTALDDARNHLRGVRVGANGYVSKPFTPAQIYNAIDQAMDWRNIHEKTGTAGEIQFDCRSEIPHLQKINDLLTDLFLNTRLNDRQVKDLRQAVMEMGGNAIEWGHKRNADLPLHITYRIDPTKIVLVIKDQGPGFNPTHVPHAASDENPVGHLDVRNELGLREGGFGIMLAKGLVDDFMYNDEGNEVTLIKRFPAEGEGENRDDGENP